MPDGKNYPRKFYKKAEYEALDGAFVIKLDGRIVKTPSKVDLVIPKEDLAEAISHEWNEQEEFIKPDKMPLTKLTNTAIDRVETRSTEIIDEIAKYISSDLLCYRAENPKELVEQQGERWDSVLSWAENALGIRLNVTRGIVHVDQPDASIVAAKQELGKYDAFILSGLHNMTTLLGSGILPLAIIKKHISADDAWDMAHIDEDWQAQQWGVDEEAKARREKRKNEMELLAKYLGFFL